MNTRTNKIALILFFILSFLFIIGYIFWPFLITRDFANNYNIRKFNRKKEMLENVVSASISMCKAKECLECTMYIYDFSSEIQSKLKQLGITSLSIHIQYRDHEIDVRANFYTDQDWCNRRLNNVTIEYDSSKRTDKPILQSQEYKTARMYYICLGAGWFFYVDTDYI